MSSKCRPGGRLVEDVERAGAGGLREMRGELDALGFAAAERGGGLAEPQIAEADVGENFEPRDQALRFGEERQRFLHGELQHFVDVQALVADVEDGALEARALAFFAHQLDVGEELHLDGHGAVALAIFAAAAGDVEREVAGAVAAFLGVGRGGEDLADEIEGLDVGDRVGARRAADGRLIHQDDFAQQLGFVDAAAGDLFGFLRQALPRGLRRRAGGAFAAATGR